MGNRKRKGTPRRRKVEVGHVVICGSANGPAEHDPTTGIIELGPHITKRYPDWRMPTR